VQGVLATCTGKAGHDGLGSVLAGLGRGDGVLWVGGGETMTVGIVQREEGHSEGGPGGFFLLLPCRTAWVGAEGAGARPRRLPRHGYRV
jgi:hypothetical protein